MFETFGCRRATEKLKPVVVYQSVWVKRQLSLLSFFSVFFPFSSFWCKKQSWCSNLVDHRKTKCFAWNPDEQIKANSFAETEFWKPRLVLFGSFYEYLDFKEQNQFFLKMKSSSNPMFSIETLIEETKP